MAEGVAAVEHAPALLDAFTEGTGRSRWLNSRRSAPGEN